MSLPTSAVAAYAVTLVMALASAVVHPWFDAEAHFVSALTGMNQATAAVLTLEDSSAQ